MGGNVSYTGLNNDPYGVTRFTTIYGEINNSGVTIQNGPSMTAADGFKYGVSTINDTGLTVGNATVQDNKIAIDGGPSMTKEGVANSTDAVNGGQLYSAIDNVNHDISNVDNRARKGIAGAAALAALHPMEFDPDDKVDLPALPEIKAPTPFPDNLDNKWAYDKLEELEQQGYIKGFADRTLSRNEFAAALDTAMARGAKLDERIVKEFEPELSHVRIAHVEGKGNEEGQWYERPRFSHDKVEKNGIAKKQYRIQPNK